MSDANNLSQTSNVSIQALPLIPVSAYNSPSTSAPLSEIIPPSIHFHAESQPMPIALPMSRSEPLSAALPSSSYDVPLQIESMTLPQPLPLERKVTFDLNPQVNYITPEPSYEQVQMYHIKGTNRYVTSNGYSGWTIFMCIIGILVFLLILGILFYYLVAAEVIHPEDYTPPYDPDPVDQDLGGSRNGRVNDSNAQNLDIVTCVEPTAHLVNGQCDCVAPFYGPNCNFESWNNRFFAFGTPSGEVRYHSYAPEDTDGRKSFLIGGHFDANSCSSIASNDTRSSGFIFDDTTQECRIISGELAIPENVMVDYDSSVPSTIYIKRGYNPLYPGFVCALKKNTNAIRYYATRANDDHFTKMIPGQLYVIAYTGDHMINHSQYIGIWSSTPFDLNDFYTMITNCNKANYFVDFGNNMEYNLNIPKKLQHHVYYVMYAERQ